MELNLGNSTLEKAHEPSINDQQPASGKDEWESKLWGDLITHCSSGATPYRGCPDFFKGNVKWITSGELNFNFITDTIEHISEEAVKKTNLKIHPVGTFLMAITGLEAAGTRGACGIVGEPATTNQSCMAVYPTNELLPEYLFHYYVYKGNELALKYCQGTKQQSYTARLIRILPIEIPSSLEEQRKIVVVLNEVDALTESLEQLIAKKRQIKYGVMQELLTRKRRLPGFSGSWKEKSLSELGKCYRGVSYDPSKDLFENDTGTTTRLIRSNNIQNGKLILSDLQFVSSTRVTKIQELLEKDIVICMANGSRELVGKAAQFSVYDGHKYTFGAFMGCFRPNTQDYDPDFIFYLFFSEKYRLHLSTLLAGSSINNLTPGNLESLRVNIPTNKNEQLAIAIILVEIDKEISALNNRLEKIKQIKQGMMQELLTGRIRLV